MTVGGHLGSRVCGCDLDHDCARHRNGERNSVIWNWWPHFWACAGHGRTCSRKRVCSRFCAGRIADQFVIFADVTWLVTKVDRRRWRSSVSETAVRFFYKTRTVAMALRVLKDSTSSARRSRCVFWLRSTGRLYSNCQRAGGGTTTRSVHTH